jgi:acyl-CoA synthetase (AMP-forming)/AMP-acid ligase II
LNLLLPFNKATTLWADREALVEGDERLTYGQFAARVAALIEALKSFGLKEGDRAAILAPNGYRYMECYYASALSGLVLMPLNFRLSHQEIEAILADGEASLLIAHPDFANCAKTSAKSQKQLKALIWLGGDSEQLDGHCPQYQYDDLIAKHMGAKIVTRYADSNDLAQLYYTSGTTGKPKGVMLSQGNVSTHALAAAYELGATEKDVWLHLAPMFHLADAWSVFSITWCGGKHVFIPYFNPETVLKLVEEEKISLIAMVPTMANALVNSPSLTKHSYESLRMFLTAGAPIAPELVRQIVESFSCQYVQYYGLTEASPLLTFSLLKAEHDELPAEEKIRIGARTGRSFLGAEVRVVRDNGEDVEANDQEVGEIVARGPGITLGYWKQPEATAQLIQNGWLHTGDLAVIDASGSINIVDRKKDMIITGGENVYSTEVEYVLHEHPAVLECAVFGLPDARWGEMVKAVVVRKPDTEVDEQTLIAFVKERLAHYKTPRSIDFIGELPKTGSGKIFKRGLKDQYLAAPNQART